MTEKRVVVDFAVLFNNGGGMQGQEFRLDITGDDITDAALATYCFIAPCTATSIYR